MCLAESGGTFHIVYVRENMANFVKNKTMGVWRQIAEYLYIKKRDPNAPRTQWLKYMHGMNRISIIMFLLALIVMIIRLVTKK